MLTVARLGAFETGDVVELLPALINASTTVTSAVSQMSSTVTGAIDHITVAVDRLSALPAQFVREAKTGIEEVSYAAGRGFGRGAAWNALPPVLIGVGAILVGLLAYKYASIKLEKSAGLRPAYAR